VTLPSYRGANINRPGFTAEDRIPDPQLLLRGYERAALTLNFVRSLIDGGFADLHHPEYWDLDFVRHSSSKEAYERIVQSISESLDFFEATAGQPIHESTTANFYTSHEALHLLLEQAQTRYIPRSQRWYNLSTHMPWIGMRTAALDGAHVEFFRGISNPMGIKVGPSMSAEWVQGLIATLNPNNEPGRIVLIHRMGVKDIDKRLPPLIQAVRATGSPVLWICDPMHGNTESLTSGLKTRRFENILSELETAFRIHRELGSWLGGVHFELTGEDVTECTGGARGLTDADLARAYKSQVDPRLNYEQALELAMRIAGLHSKKGAQKSAIINI
jgi:3-deoxy-7-phosphoheptulonate synthase